MAIKRAWKFLTANELGIPSVLLQDHFPFHGGGPNHNDGKLKFNSHSAEENPIIYITDFGGDYTGVNDSTTAFIDAINIALTRGDVTLDLAGGVYLISKPLTQLHPIMAICG